MCVLGHSCTASQRLFLHVVILPCVGGVEGCRVGAGVLCAVGYGLACFVCLWCASRCRRTRGLMHTIYSPMKLNLIQQLQNTITHRMNPAWLNLIEGLLRYLNFKFFSRSKPLQGSEPQRARVLKGLGSSKGSGPQRARVLKGLGSSKGSGP